MNLNNDLDLEQLTVIACFRPFRFHLWSPAWPGLTLQAFRHRLRLESSAAKQVFDHPKSITAIALGGGCSGSTDLAGAFKGSLGLSENEWRLCKNRRAAIRSVKGFRRKMLKVVTIAQPTSTL